MFNRDKSKKKRKVTEIGEEKEKPKPRKPLFAFWCSPSIHMAAKMLAKEVHEDMYIVAEHAMQLGLMDIAAAAKDPEELGILRAHLHQEHAMDHLVESVSAYDAEAAAYIREGQSLLYQREQVVRDLVEFCIRHKLDLPI